MANGRGGDEPISGVHHAPRLLRRSGKFSPEATGFKIDREDSIAVVAFKDSQPSLKRTFFRDFFQQRDALENFADGYNADEKIFFVESLQGLANPVMSSRVTKL